MSWLGSNSEPTFLLQHRNAKADVLIITKSSLPTRRGVDEKNSAKLPRNHLAKRQRQFRTGG